MVSDTSRISSTIITGVLVLLLIGCGGGSITPSQVSTTVKQPIQLNNTICTISPPSSRNTGTYTVYVTEQCNTTDLGKSWVQINTFRVIRNGTHDASVFVSYTYPWDNNHTIVVQMDPQYAEDITDGIIQKNCAQLCSKLPRAEFTSLATGGVSHKIARINVPFTPEPCPTLRYQPTHMYAGFGYVPFIDMKSIVHICGPVLLITLQP